MELIILVIIVLFLFKDYYKDLFRIIGEQPIYIKYGLVATMIIIVALILFLEYPDKKLLNRISNNKELNIKLENTIIMEESD